MTAGCRSPNVSRTPADCHSSNEELERAASWHRDTGGSSSQSAASLTGPGPGDPGPRPGGQLERTFENAKCAEYPADEAAWAVQSLHVGPAACLLISRSRAGSVMLSAAAGDLCSVWSLSRAFERPRVAPILGPKVPAPMGPCRVSMGTAASES